MAEFDTNGIDDIIQQMTAMGEDVGETADEMLLSAADVVKQCWKQAAERAGHHITGGLINAIGYSSKVKKANEVKSVAIYPQGTSKTAHERDKKPTRYAAIAFRLHYGTSKRPGSRFVTSAEAAAGPLVEALWTKLWNDFLVGKGF